MLSNNRSVVCVRNGSTDRLRAVKFGARGSLTWESDCNDGGCCSSTSAGGAELGSECRKEVNRCELWI